MKTVFEPLTPAEYLKELERSISVFTSHLDGGDLLAPVPACPDWSLRDLAWHLGNVHRWACTAVASTRPPAPPASGGPREREPLVAWFRDGAGALLHALRASDAHTECWTLGPRLGTVGFWYRRQAHETAMHAWDAARSQGEVGRFDRRFALDGIDEVVRMAFPRQVRLNRIAPLARSLALEPTDADGARWVLATTGEGPESASDADAAAAVRGPSDSIVLLLWARISVESPGLSVTGDLDAARAVLGTSITP